MSPSKTKNYAASVRQRLLNYARSSGQDFGKTIDLLRIFLLPPLESIQKSKLFKMAWPPNGPWQ
jgi:hypothetical protein